MLKPAFDRAMVWTVDHRRTTALTVVVITLFAIVGYLRPQWVRSLFVSSDLKTVAHSSEPVEEFQPLPDIDPVSLSESDAVMVVQSDAFFTPDGARAMRHVVEKL